MHIALESIHLDTLPSIAVMELTPLLILDMSALMNLIHQTIREILVMLMLGIPILLQRWMRLMRIETVMSR